MQVNQTKRMFRKSEWWYRVYNMKIYVLFFILVAGTSCNKNDLVGLGLNETLSANQVDTATIEASTVLLDSLPTAGKSVILAGHTSDPELGTMNVSSFFQITPTEITASSIPDDASLDSVRLKLKYNGYYYGDTLQTQELGVYHLSERMYPIERTGSPEPEETNVFSSSSTFYNKTQVKYEKEALGKITFRPRPASKDSLLVPIDLSIGNDLLAKIRAGSSIISNTEEFLDYFKGLALVPGSSMGNAVIGYTDTAEVKLYYSYSGTKGLREKGELKFSLYNNSYQFNNFIADRSSTPLKEVSLSNKVIPSSLTSEKCYIQGGTGLVTRISIPYLSNLSARTDLAINKAELIIPVMPNTENIFSLPQRLVLLVADKYGRPTQVLADTHTSLSYLTLIPSNGMGGLNYYSFPLTDYVSKANTTYKNTSLYLSLPVEDLEKSVGRVVVGAPANTTGNIKLRITYTKLN